MLTPRNGRPEYLDVVSAMSEQTSGKKIALDMMLSAIYTNGSEI